MSRGLTSRQESDVQLLLRRIKDAHDQNMDESVIKERTQDLELYLEREGIVLPPEER